MLITKKSLVLRLLLFRSVAYEMAKFFIAYIPLLIGFMMTFIILFSDRYIFETFLGPFGKVINKLGFIVIYLNQVLAMMTGEFEYVDLVYPTQGRIENNTIFEEPETTHFPGIGHLAVLAFILSVSFVMMNLLVALAVSDLAALAKTAKHDQLISQVVLINYVERSMQYMPKRCQSLFKTFKVFNVGKGFKMLREVNYADSKDTSLPESLKIELFDHCQRFVDRNFKSIYQKFRNYFSKNIC